MLLLKPEVGEDLSLRLHLDRTTALQCCTMLSPEYDFLNECSVCNNIKIGTTEKNNN